MALALFTGCNAQGIEEEASFIGVVLERQQNGLLVAPAEGSQELSSADQIMVSIGKDTQLRDKGKDQPITADDIQVGNQVEIFYRGGIAESYPAQIHGSYRINRLEGLVVEARDENFVLKTYIDKLQFKAGEEIQLYSTIEYIGEGDSVEIWSAEPFFHHIIERDGKVISGGLTMDLFQRTQLKRGEVYVLSFKKSGGYSQEDPEAEFYKEFFAEKALKLPQGTYVFSGVTDFSLDEAQKEKVVLKTSFTVQVE